VRMPWEAAREQGAQINGIFAPLLRRVHKRLIHNRVALVFQRMVVRAAHALDHAHKHDVVRGVDPESCACGPVPKEGAFSVG